MAVYKTCKYCGAYFTNGSNDYDSMPDHCGMCSGSLLVDNLEIRSQRDYLASKVVAVIADAYACNKCKWNDNFEMRLKQIVIDLLDDEGGIS